MVTRNLTLALVLAGGAAAAEPVRVVALGDSLTAGYGLGRGDGFVAQLQGWLDAHGADATVIDAGVSGDTTAAGLARVDWTIGGGADAMIVALGGNDFLRGVDPALSRANLDAILDAADAADLPVLLVGIDAGSNYGPAFEAAFDAMYPDLAEEHGTLLQRDWFEGLRGRDLAPLMQADGLHPSAAGVALIVDEMGPAVLELIGRAEAG